MYPIRYVIPLDQPGTPPQKVRFESPQTVRFAPVQEFFYNVGALNPNVIHVTPPIDLGPLEDRVATWMIAHKFGANSIGQVLTIQGSYDNLRWYHLPQAGGAQGFAWVNYNGNEMVVQGRPLFQKVRAVYKNGATAQTDLKIHIVLMSGV